MRRDFQETMRRVPLQDGENVCLRPRRNPPNNAPDTPHRRNQTATGVRAHRMSVVEAGSRPSAALTTRMIAAGRRRPTSRSWRFLGAYVSSAAAAAAWRLSAMASVGLLHQQHSKKRVLHSKKIAARRCSLRKVRQASTRNHLSSKHRCCNQAPLQWPPNNQTRT